MFGFAMQWQNILPMSRLDPQRRSPSSGSIYHPGHCYYAALRAKLHIRLDAFGDQGILIHKTPFVEDSLTVDLLMQIRNHYGAFSRSTDPTKTNAVDNFGLQIPKRPGLVSCANPVLHCLYLIWQVQPVFLSHGHRLGDEEDGVILYVCIHMPTNVPYHLLIDPRGLEEHALVHIFLRRLFHARGFLSRHGWDWPWLCRTGGTALCASIRRRCDGFATVAGIGLDVRI